MTATAARPSTEHDADLALRLAERAGDLLLAARDGGELGGRALADEGDRLAQEFLAAELEATRPGDAVLSEEAADPRARLSASRVWIIDPLDGTREYAEGRHDWAVHVALWEDGDLAAGAVALPGRGRVFSTADPGEPPSRQTGPMSRRRWSAQCSAPALMSAKRGRPAGAGSTPHMLQHATDLFC